MIDELISENRFNEALELLTDDSEQSRYYRLVCLHGLGEYIQGKQEGLIALNKAKDTYYDVVAIYLTILKELEEFDEALDLVVKELSMPYIPYHYETVFNTAYDELILAKQEANYDVNYDRNATFSEEEMENILLQENVNQELLSILLDQLNRINIRRLLGPIRSFLNKTSNNPLFKTTIMEVLIDQQIDEEMTVEKYGEVYDFNPSYYPIVFEQEAALTISELLHHGLEHENPSLLEQCIELLYIYLYSIYPKPIYDTSYGAIAGAIHYYLAVMQSLSIDIEEVEILYHTSESEIQEIIDEIDNKIMPTE